MQELDAERLARVRESMGDEFQEFVELFARESEKHVSHLEEAVQADDTQTARRAAHTLRSSAAWVGLEGLSDTLADIESMPDGASHDVWEARAREARELREHAMELLRG
jgi:HPt (histidine-containing phosphotransfer) domain-containing protein